MKKMKVMTVVGTRPEIIRLSSVINQLDAVPSIEHVLVHTGQNYDYELNEVFFNDFKIARPKYFLDAAKGSAVETIGYILIEIEKVLEIEKPDAFLILGDTNSCLSAIAAKRRHIPIFHMEAGNRCFDQRVPEETNRRIVDHIADINLTYSDIAREYLLAEGLPADRVIKTGSPMFEVLNSKTQEIESSDILKRLDLKSNEYFVVSAHREENINSDQNFKDFVDAINSLAVMYKFPIVISTHPRTRKRIESLGIEFDPLVIQMKPLGFIDYIKLQKEAYVVLSDSGTISEETSILGLKSLNIRQAHERPEAMEEGTVMMVGMKKERIIQALSVLDSFSGNSRLVSDYSMPNVSEKVVKIIVSYIDYINLNVWKQA